MATFVFGTGMRSKGEAAPAPAVAAPSKPLSVVAAPAKSVDALPDILFLLRVQGHGVNFASFARTDEELKQKIKARRYPGFMIKIEQIYVNVRVEECPGEISFLALGLDDSWDKRLVKDKLLTLGKIVKAGPARLKAIGFGRDEIRAIRVRMKKFGVELPLLNPRKKVA
jgi:hypothetical protein